MDAGDRQKAVLRGRLHALGHDLHPERPADADDRVHDRRGIHGEFDVLDEPSVDLDLAEGEMAKVHQARETVPKSSSEMPTPRSRRCWIDSTVFCSWP